MCNFKFWQIVEFITTFGPLVSLFVLLLSVVVFLCILDNMSKIIFSLE